MRDIAADRCRVDRTKGRSQGGDLPDFFVKTQVSFVNVGQPDGGFYDQANNEAPSSQVSRKAVQGPGRIQKPAALFKIDKRPVSKKIAKAKALLKQVIFFRGSLYNLHSKCKLCPNLTTPLVGAFGAISGLMGAYTILDGKKR